MTAKIEENFRIGVITDVRGDSAQVLTLHSRRLREPVDKDFRDEDLAFTGGLIGRAAIDTDVPFDLPFINLLEEDIDRDTGESERDKWTIGGPYSLFSRTAEPGLDQQWSFLRRGTVIHIHDFSQDKPVEQGRCTQYSSEYCVQPTVLDEEGIIRAIAVANERRKQNIADEIERLELAEQALLRDLEVIDFAQPIRLFEGIHVAEDEQGRKFLKVPERVVVHPRYGIQLLGVDLWYHPGMEPDKEQDLSYTGNVRYFATGSQMWVPYICPLEEVDERGVPINSDRRRGRVEITLYNPYRSLHGTDGIEEEKAIVELNENRWMSTRDDDIMVGNQGFGGVVFSDFCDTSEEGTYHEFKNREGGGWYKSSRVQHIPTEMLVPVDDLELLQELEIRLPGFL